MKYFLVIVYMLAIFVAHSLTIPLGRLTWDYTPTEENPESDLVFIVRSSPSLNIPLHAWPIVAEVSGNKREWPVSFNQPQEFFTVTASNVIRHTESDFAK